MKYVIDLDSPDFQVLLDAAQHELTNVILWHSVTKRRWGAGHERTVVEGVRKRAAERCVAALIVAQQNAEPERATRSRDDVVTINSYFEEDLPRPVPPRPKASNLRRRLSKGVV